MSQLSYPGVYIQEVASGVRTITGVATSITTFFGRATKGPLNKPVRCLSFADFLRNFSGSPAGCELAASVKQFYDNGGGDCYVVRLARGARKAAVRLENVGGTHTLVASAKVEGAWGNGLRMEVNYATPNPGDTFNLVVIQEEAGQTVATETHSNLSMNFTSPRFAPTFVTQSSDLVDLALDAGMGSAADPGSTYRTSTAGFNGFSEARRPLTDPGGTMAVAATNLLAILATSHRFEISVDDSAYVPVSFQGLALTGVNIVSELQTAINNALAVLVPAPTVTVTLAATTGVGRLLRITADSGNVSSVRVRRAASDDLASALMMGPDYGGVELTRWSSLRPAPTGSYLPVGSSSMGVEHLNTLSALAQNAVTGITIGADSPVSFDLVTTAGGDDWRIDAIGTSPNANNDGVREKLRIIADAITNSAGGSYRASLHGYQISIRPKSGTFNEIPASIVFVGAGIPALTLNTRQYKLGHDGTSASAEGGSFDPGTTTFNVGEDGDDGLAPDFATYVGNEALQTGFHAMDPVDIFNLMVIPRDEEVSATDRFNIWGPASIYCESRRAFLLIDAPDDWVDQGLAAIVQNSSSVNDLRATVVKDHSAVFYPKVIVNIGGTQTAIGSTGAMAGLLARTDATRGVWKAAAGVEADLRGITGLEVKLTDLENGVLNKLGVNCARSFVSGFVNWGARTMDGADDLGSEWKYIPIRRLSLFLKESLYRGTQWVVFEPNDEPLWAQIRQNLGAFMNGLFRQGAFQGTTPDQAFYVKCDSETTTQADRNLGIVNIEVGFAPLKPAEFVVVKIQQIAGDLS